MIRIHPRRVGIGIISLVIGFLVPFHFIHDHRTFLDRNDGTTYTFTFTDLLANPGALKQNDSNLVEHVAKNLIKPPSMLPYNLTSDKIDRGQDFQAGIIDRYFSQKKNGFFIEAGAYDGEYLSNSLFLEKERNWTGLLVEPNIFAFETLQQKNRKAHTINSCLAIHKYPEAMLFDSADVYGGLIVPRLDAQMYRLRKSAPKRKFHSVQCVPVYTLLLALGNPTVDYFSLDVEGSELEILLTIPFDKVDIRAFSIEVVHSGKNQIKRFMDKKGYEIHKVLKDDILFVKRNQTSNEV